MTKLLPPSFLRRLSSDEYEPMPYRPADLAVIHATLERMGDSARRRGLSPWRMEASRLATAAGLQALNHEWKDRFYEVSPETAIDDDAADEQLRGQGIVIDVQTHYMAPRAARTIPHSFMTDLYHPIMPDWWTDMDGMVAWTLEDYVTKLFLECENAVVVLTSGPGTEDSRMLFNDEMASTRILTETLGARGRLLNHAVVHADLPEELEAMDMWKEEFKPAGWKVYTRGRFQGRVGTWELDDERHGLPFLERARKLGVNLVCAHKGLNRMVDNGSPRDIGPAARAFPDLNFMVYHSGYELPIGGAPGEGPYTEETRNIGVNRLISSMLDAGLSAGCNIYAEMGTTWFSLVRRPADAAHFLGKLIHWLGEDNVVWGSDSIWYGSPQPIIDAFRAFQIPDSMCEEFGYRKLTPLVKEKILSLNAARLYDIDLAAAAHRAANDDLAWTRRIVEEYRKGPHDFLGH